MQEVNTFISLSFKQYSFWPRKDIITNSSRMWGTISFYHYLSFWYGEI